jgi:hypothetical protein
VREDAFGHYPDESQYVWLNLDECVDHLGVIIKAFKEGSNLVEVSHRISLSLVILDLIGGIVDVINSCEVRKVVAGPLGEIQEEIVFGAFKRVGYGRRAGHRVCVLVGARDHGIRRHVDRSISRYL